MWRPQEKEVPHINVLLPYGKKPYNASLPRISDASTLGTSVSEEDYAMDHHEPPTSHEEPREHPHELPMSKRAAVWLVGAVMFLIWLAIARGSGGSSSSSDNFVPAEGATIRLGHSGSAADQRVPVWRNEEAAQNGHAAFKIANRSGATWADYYNFLSYMACDVSNGTRAVVVESGVEYEKVMIAEGKSKGCTGLINLNDFYQ